MADFTLKWGSASQKICLMDFNMTDEVNFVDDLVVWFLDKYRKTRNAEVDGNFLVYLPAFKRHKPLVDNRDQLTSERTTNDTTLTDLLTSTASPTTYPVKRQIGSSYEYDFGLVRDSFVKQLVRYLNDRGAPVERAGSLPGNYQITFISEHKVGDADRSTTFNWNLNSVFESLPNNPTLGETAQAVYDSYRGSALHTVVSLQQPVR